MALTPRKCRAMGEFKQTTEKSNFSGYRAIGQTDTIRREAWCSAGFRSGVPIIRFLSPSVIIVPINRRLVRVEQEPCPRHLQARLSRAPGLNPQRALNSFMSLLPKLLEIVPDDGHSSRSATIGSTRHALRAGA